MYLDRRRTRVGSSCIEKDLELKKRACIFLDACPFGWMISFGLFCLFRMALGAGCRRFFGGLVFFIVFSVTTPAVCMQRLGMIIFYLFFLGKFLLGFFTFGGFSSYFMTLDALLNIVAFFQVGKRLVVLVVVTLAATVFVKFRILFSIFL